MIAALRSWLIDRRFRRFVRDLDEREADARRRGDMRALGRVRRERRARITQALQGAIA